MRNLHHLEDSVLIDMLAKYTLKLTHLFRIHKGIDRPREYRDCKRKVDKIIDELDNRRLIPKRDPSQNEERLPHRRI